ncbi:zinc-ribbon domain-containing protein [Peptoniphilus equinus]|uniref:Zinc-ribbon domain-containing protein n=1 Tax=Peptoniphilus equinus TaxID=3016343 RepID=A0ABY7QUP0_9FIRM|nr:zinc-ribbon domain-containing protein [Peptoniphilus equinus]WBW50492.1 zinc-ribbon domain-containing protein [Peptoniphilus equinus]
MYCPNCGFKIQDTDNFCPNCGHNLKNVVLTVVEHKQQISPANDTTQTFTPVKNLSAIDNTNDLKDILKAVDEKIAKNISNYEKYGAHSDQVIGPKTSNVKVPQDLSDKASDFRAQDLDFKRNDTLPDKKEKNVPDASSSNHQTSPVDKKVSRPNDKATTGSVTPQADTSKAAPSSDTTPKEKKSLKARFKDFINEDDDEYSIFSSFTPDTDAHDAPKDLPLDTKPATNTTSQVSHNFEADKYHYDYKSFTELVNAELEKEAATQQTSPSPTPSEKTTPKVSLKEKFTSKFSKKLAATDKADATFNTATAKDNATTPSKHLTASKTGANSPSNKAQTDTLVVTPKADVTPVSPSISNPRPVNLAQHTLLPKGVVAPHVQPDLERPSDSQPEHAVTDAKPSTVSQTTATPSPSKVSLLPALPEFLVEGVAKLIDKLNPLATNTALGLAMLGSVIPVALSMTTLNHISILLIVLAVVKVAIRIFQFYLPLSVAVDKAWIDTTVDELKKHSAVNYLICEAACLIMFVLSPWQGFLGFTPLSALTALPVATVVILILSTLVGLIQYRSTIHDKNKLEFIGWYGILFFIFEFTAKIIFMLTDILV